MTQKLSGADDAFKRPTIKYLYVKSSHLPFTLSAENVDVALMANKILQKFITRLEKEIGVLLYRVCTRKESKWMKQLYQGQNETIEFGTDGTITAIAHDAKDRTRTRKAISKVIHEMFDASIAKAVNKAVVLGELRASLEETMDAGGIFNLIEEHAAEDCDH